MTNNWKDRVGGLKPSEFDPRDYKLPVTYSAVSLPEEFNSTITYNVHDQGKFNNCAAHALSSYIEILLKRKGAFKEISFPWYYGDRNYSDYKDEGLISRDLLKTAQKDGGLYLSDYNKVEEMKQAMYTFNNKFPSLKSKAQNIRLGNYYQCSTVQQVKEAIYKYGSCLIGTYLFESFKNVAEGKTLYMNEPIIVDDSYIEDPIGGHMMIAVGWIKDYLIVQNSWGEEFGKNGYFYMPFTLSTWNERTGFPVSVFEAWAIDGIYLNGKFTSLDGSETPIEPEVPDSKDKWYKTSNGKWRYRLDNGKDATGWLKVDGIWYCFESNGDMMASKWNKSNGKWCYLKDNGAMAIGWLKIDSRWYWFDNSGYAITGWKNINDVDYYFAEKGFGKIKECQCMEASK